MAQAHMMTDPAAALMFVKGGKAVFTVVSKKTGTRFTYRLRESKDGMVKFGSVRKGPSYDYLGYFKTHFFGDGIKTSAKSTHQVGSPEFAALAFTVSMLNQGHIHPAMEFWHEGKCGCCGRALTDPVSIARGIGPDCWSRRGERLAA